MSEETHTPGHRMKTINLSKRQWEWMYWLTGTGEGLDKAKGETAT